MKMKNIALLFLLASGIFAACDKADDLPFYGAGVEPVLTASATTIAPAPADSLSDVLTLSWSDPAYATDTTNVKYLVQVDAAGRDFSQAITREINGTRSTVFKARELNNIMLGYGFQFNQQYQLEVRVISSYANNNERRISNVLTINATPYKVPPKVQLPFTERLFLVGDATEGGWNNPVPDSLQEFVRIDETTWAGIFNLKGGKQYLALPENGKWDNKYSVADNGIAGLAEGGDFLYNANDNFPGPAADGQYKIMFDFQAGKFTVTPYTQQHGLPSELYIVGNAIDPEWANPIQKDEHRFKRVNSTTFEIPRVTMKANGKFLLLPSNGSWDRKFGEGDTPGVIAPQGPDITGPTQAGDYKVTVNFIDNSLTLTKL